MKPTNCLRSRYITAVGRAFLLEVLYGSKYAPHIGTYNMPFLYVKTVLMCASAYRLEKHESRYLHGLIECLLPSNASQDNLTKLELLQFVDALPAGDNSEWFLSDVSGEERSMSKQAHNASFSSSPSAHAAQTGAAQGSPAPSRTTAPEHISPDAFSFLSSSTFPSSLARLLVYDAVAACVADSVYSASERERVALVASQVGLSAAEREHIERTALQERALSVRKRTLLLLPDVPASKDTASSLESTTPAAGSHSSALSSASTSDNHGDVSGEVDKDDDDELIDASAGAGRRTQREQTRAYVEGRDAVLPEETAHSPRSLFGQVRAARQNAVASREPSSPSSSSLLAARKPHAPKEMTHAEALRILRRRAAVSENVM